MKDMNRTVAESTNRVLQSDSSSVSRDSAYQYTSKARTFKLASIGMSAVIALGGAAFLTQQAQAFSALALVNGVSLSGGVAVSKDIAYGNAALQNLDIYYPKPLAQAMQTQNPIYESYPMIVFVHGGSWESGSKEDYAFVGQSLAQAGYVTAVINYRKAPEHLYPDFVQDTAKAIAWSHKNASKFYANSERLAVVGHSAGAFNAIAAISNEDFLAPYGMSPADIRAVVGIAGPYSYDFRKFDSASAFAADATPDQVMPDRQLKGKQPPYLLLTAENDKIVYDTNTIKMIQALNNFGATVETGQIKGASHATSIGAMAMPFRWVNDVRAQVLTYLAKTVN